VSAFLDLPVTVYEVGGREWRARCRGNVRSCTYAWEPAARKAVAAAVDASGVLSVPCNPLRVTLEKMPDETVVGRVNLQMEVTA